MLRLEDSREMLKDEILETAEDYFSNETEEIFQDDIDDFIMGTYNASYYIIGTYRAKQFISKHLDLLLETLKNYEDSFGVQYHDITNAEALASLIMIDLSQQYIDEILEHVNNNIE